MLLDVRQNKLFVRLPASSISWEFPWRKGPWSPADSAGGGGGHIPLLPVGVFIGRLSVGKAEGHKTGVGRLVISTLSIGVKPSWE